MLCSRRRCVYRRSRAATFVRVCRHTTSLVLSLTCFVLSVGVTLQPQAAFAAGVGVREADVVLGEVRSSLQSRAAGAQLLELPTSSATRPRGNRSSADAMPQWMIPATLPLLLESQAVHEVRPADARRQIGCLLLRWLNVAGIDTNSHCHLPEGAAAPPTADHKDTGHVESDVFNLFLERSSSQRMKAQEPPLAFGIAPPPTGARMPVPQLDPNAIQTATADYLRSFDPMLKCAVYGVGCAVRIANEITPRPENPNHDLLFGDGDGQDGSGRRFLGKCIFASADAEAAALKLKEEVAMVDGGNQPKGRDVRRRHGSQAEVGCNTDVDCDVAAQSNLDDLEALLDAQTGGDDSGASDIGPRINTSKAAGPRNHCKLLHGAGERSFLADELQHLKSSLEGETQERQQAAALSYLAQALQFQAVNRSAFFAKECTTTGGAPAAGLPPSKESSGISAEATEQSALTKFVADELQKRQPPPATAKPSSPPMVGLLQGAQECPSPDMLRVFCVLTGHVSAQCERAVGQVSSSLAGEGSNAALSFRDDQVFPLYFVLNRFLVDRAAVRSRPSASAPLVDTIHNSTVVEVVGWHRNWLHVTAMWVRDRDEAGPARRTLAQAALKQRTKREKGKETHSEPVGSSAGRIPPGLEATDMPQWRPVTVPAGSWVLQSEGRMAFLLPQGTPPPAFPRRFVVNSAAGVLNADVLPSVPEERPAFEVLGLVPQLPVLATLAPPAPYVALQQRTVHGELWLEIFLGAGPAAPDSSDLKSSTPPNHDKGSKPLQEVNSQGANGHSVIRTGWARRVGASPPGNPFARTAFLVPYDAPPTDGFCAGDLHDITCDSADAYYLDSPDASPATLPTPKQVVEAERTAHTRAVSFGAVIRGFSRSCGDPAQADTFSAQPALLQNTCVQKGFCVPVDDDNAFSIHQPRCSRLSTCGKEAAAGEASTVNTSISATPGRRTSSANSTAVAAAQTTCRLQSRCAGNRHHLCTSDKDCAAFAKFEPDGGRCLHSGRCAHRSDLVCLDASDCPLVREDGLDAEPDICISRGRCARDSSVECVSTSECQRIGEERRAVIGGGHSTSEGIVGGADKPLDLGRCLIGFCSQNNSLACGHAAHCEAFLSRTDKIHGDHNGGPAHHCIFGGVCQSNPAWLCSDQQDCLPSSSGGGNSTGNGKAPVAPASEKGGPASDLCLYGRCSPVLATPPSPQKSISCSDTSHCPQLPGSSFQSSCILGGACSDEPTWQCMAHEDCDKAADTAGTSGQCLFDGQCSGSPPFLCNNNSDCTVRESGTANASNVTSSGGVMTDIGSCVHGGLGACAQNQAMGCSTDAHCVYKAPPGASIGNTSSVNQTNTTQVVDVGPCLAGGHCSLGQHGPCGSDIHCLPNDGRCIGPGGAAAVKIPSLSISGLPSGALDGVKADDLSAALAMIPADIRASLPGLGGPPPAAKLSASQGNCINDKCMALLKTWPPQIIKFPMCLLCCLLGLCLGGGGPAAALMAALLSVGSTLPKTITALLAAFKLPMAKFKLGFSLKIPPLPLPPGTKPGPADGDALAEAAAAGLGDAASAAADAGAHATGSTSRSSSDSAAASNTSSGNINSTTAASDDTSKAPNAEGAANKSGATSKPKGKPGVAIGGVGDAGGNGVESGASGHAVDIGDEVRVHLTAESGSPWTSGSVVGKDPDEPPPDGTVDIYLTNGSTIRLIPARNVFPSSDPNRSTSGAEMLGGNASNSNRARSGELDEATLQAAQRELASLHVPGSRAAAIVKEIKAINHGVYGVQSGVSGSHLEQVGVDEPILSRVREAGSKIEPATSGTAAATSKAESNTAAPRPVLSLIAAKPGAGMERATDFPEVERLIGDPGQTPNAFTELEMRHIKEGALLVQQERPGHQLPRHSGRRPRS